MSEFESKIIKLEKFKYPLLILILGLFLMLLPSGASSAPEETDETFQQLLSCSEGVGEARVIVSESGVVVVCRGADDAKVRLDIMRAIGSYTGFSSDKITVLKMAD